MTPCNADILAVNRRRIDAFNAQWRLSRRTSTTSVSQW